MAVHQPPGSSDAVRDPLDYIAQANLAAKYSFKDVVRILKGIRANKINGQWRLTQFTKNIRKLCTDLNIKIDGSLIG